MIDGAFVGAGSHRRVAERRKFVVIRLKNLPSILRVPLQNDNHEGTHEESRVRLLCVI